MEEKNIIPSLKKRYATRIFDTSKKISEEDKQMMFEATNLMPTSFGLQPFRIFAVEDEALRTQLMEHSYGQSYVAENSLLVVFATRTDIDENMVKEFIRRTEKTRGLEEQSLLGYQNMIISSLVSQTQEAKVQWAKRQTYIALGGMIVAASERGIDNHAMEGFDPQKYNEILGLTDKNLEATVIMALGYRDESDEWQNYKKVRLDLDDLVTTV